VDGKKGKQRHLDAKNRKLSLFRLGQKQTRGKTTFSMARKNLEKIRKGGGRGKKRSRTWVRKGTAGQGERTRRRSFFNHGDKGTKAGDLLA